MPSCFHKKGKGTVLAASNMEELVKAFKENQTQSAEALYDPRVKQMLEDYYKSLLQVGPVSEEPKPDNDSLRRYPKDPQAFQQSNSSERTDQMEKFNMSSAVERLIGLGEKIYETERFRRKHEFRVKPMWFTVHALAVAFAVATAFGGMLFLARKLEQMSSPAPVQVSAEQK